MTLPIPCICLVTDRRRVAAAARTTRDEILALERQLDEALSAGVDLIQLRERDLEAVALCALTAGVVSRASPRTRVVVNDRADVALAAGAAGVHLRGDGPAIARVRTLGSPGWLVGRSIHALDDAQLGDDADYLIFGTVFPSQSKAMGPPAGVAALRTAALASKAAVLAIGGVAPAVVPACREAGAAGVAAIGVFLPKGSGPGALGAAEAVRALRSAWNEFRPR